MEFSLAVLAASVLLSSALASGQSLPSAWVTGIATHYGGAQDGLDPSTPSFGTKDGACGYGVLNPNVYPYWSVGALSLSNQFSVAGPSQGCGQCFEVKCMNSGGSYAGNCGSSQSIIITITDVCPECESNHIDIQALTFNKIAPMAVGRIDIQYRRVDCTPPLPVSIDIDNNVGVGGWLRLVVEKTAGFGGITAVGIRTTGTQSWLAMTNKFGSAWEVSNAPGLPWDFQFTSDSSQVIVANSLVMQNGQIGSIPTGVQFSLSGSTGSSPISYDSAPGSAPPQAAASAAKPAAATPPSGAATPPSSSTNSPPSPNSPSGCCQDVQPTAFATCQQQQAWGKCSDSWMVNGNFCQLTCGACPASCGGSSSNGGSAVPPGAAGQAAANGAKLTSPPPPSSNSSPPSPSPPSSTPPSPSPPSSPPPPGSALPPFSSGAVQTYSLSASPPPPSSSSSSSPPPPSGSCTDISPDSSKTCSQLASVANACSTTIPAQNCLQSCFRAPCPTGR